MKNKQSSSNKKTNKNLVEVAEITGSSYGYVRQVATGKRSNIRIERAIIAFEEKDFATLEEIKKEAEAESLIKS